MPLTIYHISSLSSGTKKALACVKLGGMAMVFGDGWDKYLKLIAEELEFQKFEFSNIKSLVTGQM
jgi:hypothetical protein